MSRVQLKVGFWQDISVVPLKIRPTSSGVHLFGRRTGLNILLEPVSTGLRAPSLAPRPERLFRSSRPGTRRLSVQSMSLWRLRALRV